MEMLQFDFIQRAISAGLAISLITPILGLILILRRQSLMADTLSHISLAGVALGTIYHMNPTLSTLIVVIIASIIIEYLRREYVNFTEISIAMMMATGMAIALILVSLNTNTGNFRIDQYLFGSIILVSQEGVHLLWGLAIGLMLLYIIFKKPLYVVTFDEATAQTQGLPVKWISLFFSVITGVTISIMMPIVGALLVSALIVIPSATAIRISKNFVQAILIGVVINVVGIISGIAISFYQDTPPGATITLLFMAIFLFTLLISTIKNKIRR